jgi:hypothetical protein
VLDFHQLPNFFTRAQRATQVAALCAFYFSIAHNAPLKPAALCAFYCASVLWGTAFRLASIFEPAGCAIVRGRGPAQRGF